MAPNRFNLQEIDSIINLRNIRGTMDEPIRTKTAQLNWLSPIYEGTVTSYVGLYSDSFQQ
jgi:hypothetical protein